MSKSNKILIFMFSFVVVCVIGYALFSESITITGTATASGSFDISYTCQTGLLTKLGTPSTYNFSNEGGYTNDSCQVINDTILLNTDFLFPGASRIYTIKITNNGTMDAYYSVENISYNRELCVADNVQGNNMNCISTTERNVVTKNNGYQASMSWRNVALESPDGNLLSESEILEFWDSVNENGILKPGYSAYIILRLSILHLPNYNPSSGEMYAKFIASYKIPFTQVTVN